MRTKTLLLAAVLSAAGAASSLAQVYSVNAVGYINLNLPLGFAMIANQLNASPNNNLSTIMPNLPAGTTVFKFNTTSASFDSFISLGGGAWLPDTTLNPGEGAFIQLGAATTITLVGEVPQGQPITPPVSMVAGLTMISSQVPQSVGLGSIGLQLASGDTVFRFNRTTQSYDSYISLGGSNWLPSDPTPDVGESVWVQRAAAGTWSRSFSVNN
jgi:hypothetical protein